MIRKAGKEDISAIRSMAEIVFRHTYAPILTPDQIDYMMEWMYSEDSLIAQMDGGHVFLIDDDRAYVSFRYEGCADDGVKVYHIEKLYVLPQWQGRGLGRELFDMVVGQLRQTADGPFRIELNVNRHNPAVAFYEHLGMRRKSSGDFPIGGGFFMNDYIMSYE